MSPRPADAEAPSIAVVGGCGHVGLPLAVAFSLAGCRVAIVDRSVEAVASVRAGRVHFMDEGLEAGLARALEAGLQVGTDPGAVAAAEVVVCVIGTPIDEHLNPQVDKLFAAVDELLPHLRAGQLFVLRSTVFPGATETLARRLAARVPGVEVAFCPERVAQGVALREIGALPQLVSGTTPAARERAAALFARLAPQTVPLEPLEAELAKMFCNTWRYIQFAAANQFYALCLAHGLDYYRILAAITQDYPRMRSLPGAGFAAGPCLFKDTMQLAAFYNYEFSLGQAAMLVNEGLPRRLVQHLRQAGLEGKVVGLLGMTFKGDNDDLRDSLAFKLRKLLLVEAREVVCTDEHARGAWWRPLEDVLARADLLVVCAPHARYRALAPRQPVLDPWNVLGRGGLLA